MNFNQFGMGNSSVNDNGVEDGDVHIMSILHSHFISSRNQYVFYVIPTHLL